MQGIKDRNVRIAGVTIKTSNGGKRKGVKTEDHGFGGDSFFNLNDEGWAEKQQCTSSVIGCHCAPQLLERRPARRQWFVAWCRDPSRGRDTYQSPKTSDGTRISGINFNKNLLHVSSNSIYQPHQMETAAESFAPLREKGRQMAAGCLESSCLTNRLLKIHHQLFSLKQLLRILMFL